MKENGSDEVPSLNRNQKTIAPSREEEIRLILRNVAVGSRWAMPIRPITKGPYIIQGRSSGDESYVSVCGQKGSQFRDNGRIETRRILSAPVTNGRNGVTGNLLTRGRDERAPGAVLQFRNLKNLVRFDRCCCNRPCRLRFRLNF